MVTVIVAVPSAKPSISAVPSPLSVTLTFVGALLSHETALFVASFGATVAVKVVVVVLPSVNSCEVLSKETPVTFTTDATTLTVTILVLTTLLVLQLFTNSQ